MKHTQRSCHICYCQKLSWDSSWPPRIQSMRGCPFHHREWVCPWCSRSSWELMKMSGSGAAPFIYEAEGFYRRGTVKQRVIAFLSRTLQLVKSVIFNGTLSFGALWSFYIASLAILWFQPYSNRGKMSEKNLRARDEQLSKTCAEAVHCAAVSEVFIENS